VTFPTHPEGKIYRNVTMAQNGVAQFSRMAIVFGRIPFLIAVKSC
jgi:hypothetical protein